MAAEEIRLSGQVRRNYRSPSEIVAGRGEPAAPAVEEMDGEPASPAKKADPLPLPGEPYRASARFMERLQAEQRVLHFVLRDGTVEGFAYSDLRRVRLLPGDRPGSGPVLLLRFVEAEVTDVEIRGRHLRDMHYYIGLGVLPWVWEYPGEDFEEEATPVITRITIRSKQG